MKTEISNLIEQLVCTHRLTEDEYAALIEAYSPETAAILAREADRVRREVS